VTYAEEKGRIGKQVCQIVELDLDFCTLTYATAPCEAVLGTTGPDRCFNTRKTCQDAANYDPAAKTYRFCDLMVNDPALQPYIPSLLSVSTAPSRIDPSHGVGLRASVSCAFQDHPLSDLTFGADKYARLRSYDSATRGTFWSKLLARNPYYQGRPMRVRTGYLTEAGRYDPANFETRLYIIERIEGPDSRGRVRVTGKDILKQADDDRAQAPQVTTGKLSVAYLAAATSLTLLPVGVGDEQYPASGVACMGDEIVTFTRVADVFTVVRGTNGTTAVDQGASTAFQLCLQYVNETVSDVIYDLLTNPNYAGIDTAFMDKANWDIEVASWLPALALNTIITKPVGVNALLKELCEQATGYLWWDEREQLVKFKVLHPEIGNLATQINDLNHILADSVTVKEEPDRRLSQVWIHYVRRDPTKNLDEQNNYGRVYVDADLTAESADEYNESRVKEIFSRWFSTTNDGDAITLGARILARFRDNPKTITFRLDAKDSDLWTGDLVKLTIREIQDVTGAEVEIVAQVLEVKEVKAGHIYQYEVMNTFFSGRYGFITEDDMVDYLLATVDQRLSNGFICEDSGLMPNGDEGYKII
jgi:hypothetical protein